MEPTRSEGRVVQSGDGAIAVRATRIDGVTMESVLPLLDRPRLLWTDGTGTVAAGGATVSIETTGRDRFEVVEAAAAAVFDALEAPASIPDGARPRLFGGFSFTDSHVPEGRGPWTGFPGAKFVLPAVQFTDTDEAAWMTVTARGHRARETAVSRLQDWRNRLESASQREATRDAGVSNRQYNPERPQWRQQVERAIDRISSDPLEKVVLAQSLRGDLAAPIDAAQVLTRLGVAYPTCYRFAFTPEGGGTFFGATPERLVSVRDDRVETEALAGSIGRGETTDEDEWLASQLRESAKNTHEHDLVVEAIHDQLAAHVTGIRTHPRTVCKLANVQHLETPIRGRLADDAHVLSLVEALHPTPAVGGLPPDDALDTIRETEAFDRGWYAAPVGWFDANGDGDFAVAIRSAIAADRTVTLFAGAGIVAGSDPDEEWDELQLKYRPILDALS